jgi:hypothetical protein
MEIRGFDLGVILGFISFVMFKVKCINTLDFDTLHVTQLKYEFSMNRKELPSSNS